MLSVKADGSLRIIASQSQLLSATFTLNVGSYQNDLTLYEVTECLLREEDGRVVKSPDPTDSVGGVTPTATVRYCTVTSPVWKYQSGGKHQVVVDDETTGQGFKLKFESEYNSGIYKLLYTTPRI